MKDHRDFNFVLVNTSFGYILTTYKIGTITVQNNTTDFVNFYRFRNNKAIKAFHEDRPYRGDSNKVHDILLNEPVTCLIRDPYNRLFSGIVEEFFGYPSRQYEGLYDLDNANPILSFFINEYFFPLKDRFHDELEWEKDSKGNRITKIEIFNSIPTHYYESHTMVKNIINYWFENNPAFRYEITKWLREALPIYWDQLVESPHVARYHEPLYHFINVGKVKIKNPTIKQLHHFKWENDVRHSNSIFKQPIIKAIEDACIFNSEFEKKYNNYIETEMHFYNILNDEESKAQDTENG